MSEIKRFTLIKPTVDTPFCIDFNWWAEQGQDPNVFLREYLCAEHQAAFEQNQTVKIDWVDPQTAEVQTVDGLQHVLIQHCAKQPNFITANTSLVDAVFRILLANGNIPISPVELSREIGKPADLILRTLSSGRVFMGIRPKHPSK
ncbi:hypothetical protein [Anaerolinea sp.]|uniref:hypothetical protein n=1 Tax=Anaerolinea sp. TaxID=1872519 RepID=UPI002ACF03BD|nr:hypothetical protein [Anaerolinea sp.]